MYVRELEFVYSDGRLACTLVMVTIVTAGLRIYLNQILKLKNLINELVHTIFFTKSGVFFVAKDFF